jgi:hypothetical protein
MAGGSVQHLAQRRHRRADHAGRGPLCARRGDLRWHRRDRWLGRGGAVLRDLRGHRRDRWLGRGGAVRGRARPGGGRARIRAGCGWFGHGVFPWQAGTRRSALGDRVVSGRPGRCDGGWAGARPLAGAQQGRRQLPAAAARGGRYRAGPAAGTGGCPPAEPPAASLPLLSDGRTSGSARPGPGRATCGPDVAGVHRVMDAAGPGSARPRPSGTGIAGRDAASRASWAPAIVLTASVRICSSGSPGKLAAGAADVRCLMPRYTRTGKLASSFRNLVTCQDGQLDLPDLSRPGSPARRP